MIGARSHRYDLSLGGVAMIGVASLVVYEMVHPLPDGGLFGRIIVDGVKTGFGRLDWLVPGMLGSLGIVMIAEATDPVIALPMGFAAFSYLLLFATLFQEGGIGRTLAAILRMNLGEYGLGVAWVLLVILTYAISGRSASRLIAAAWSVLWNLRFPHLSTFFPKKPHGAVVTALPSSLCEGGEEAIDAVFHEAAASKPAHYDLPLLSIFRQPAPQRVENDNRSQLLVDTLASFKVRVKVAQVTVGPSITRYEVRPENGVSVDKIAKRRDDIALALAAPSVRIEAPIPGKSAVGIEVPNARPAVVSLREISEALPPLSEIALPMALGKDIAGKPIFVDIRTMPHLLVAGTTGSGKSVCLNAIIATLLARCTPDHVQLMLIDPKRVEFSVYNGVPHLIRPVITNVQEAASALQEIAREMDARYKTFAHIGVRNIEEHNARKNAQKMPSIVVVIDELADLMQAAGKAVEPVICRIAQLARAVGIHLIVATQRPSVDVITGLIKANIPSRIAFSVSGLVDSRVILDAPGAEHLVGNGDMLFRPVDASKPIRLQGALVTGSEIAALVGFWKAQSAPANRIDLSAAREEEPPQKSADRIAFDEMIERAARYVVAQGSASTQKLQTYLSVGHPKATRVISMLESLGIVGPNEGRKPRKVLVDQQGLKSALEGAVCSA